MDRLQYLIKRQKSIGSSDAGAIMGLSKWKTPFEVFIEKTEEITEDKEVSEAAHFGNKLKDVIAKEFTLRTGKKVRRENKCLTHKEHPFITASIDRRVLYENSILLCKTVSGFLGKEWEDEKVPLDYIVKCQHSMAITDTEKCFAAVLIGGQKLLIKEIYRDEKLIEEIIKAEIKFWTTYVVKNLPPPIDGSLAYERFLKGKYPMSTEGSVITFKAKYKNKVIRYLGLKDKIKALEEKAKALENSLKEELGEAERGNIGDFIVLWRAVFSNRIDSKALKDNYPYIYKEVSKETSSRRFEIKTKKDDYIN